MTTTTRAERSRFGSLTATRPLAAWRTVDLLTVAFLGAALGIGIWGWGQFYNGPITALKIGYAPAMGLFAGGWMIAGVMGGLIVRRPGAAFLTEVVAALVSMLPGTEWGPTVLISGILQGVGAELAFAIFGYAAFSVGIAGLAGMLSVPLEWLFETFSLGGGGGWYAEWVIRDKLAYGGFMLISGLVLAGVVGWLLTRALARVGALDALPAGQEVREHRAV